VFERFTEGARQVIVLAQEETVRLKHDRMDAEHILLGLIRQERGIAARALRRSDITLRRVGPAVVRLVGVGEAVVGPRQIPFTRRAKRILERSLMEAQSLGDRHIDTEHLLLSLVRENSGAATRIVHDLGVDIETIRDEVFRLRPEAHNVEG
jgi:ATP-dependent Clp protease ATP-binding subunit ClpC